jgi:hypothetical protein
MDKTVISDELNAAIPLYIGWKLRPYPEEDAQRLVTEYGSERGERLTEQADEILQHLYRMKPDWSQHSLASGATWAVQELKKIYPDLSEEAVAALEWIHSWWWR